VAFFDIQEETSLELVRKLATINQEPLFVKCDVTDINALKKAVAEVENKLGAVRVLINNAASDERHEPEDVTPEYWEQRLSLNLSHHFFAAQAVKPAMAEAGGGAIINMGSCSWHMAMEFMPGYTSSKAAIEGLTQSLARAYGKDRIRVNCIIPGQVWTSRQMKEIMTPEYEKFMTEKQCLPDRILPEDIAQLALFLASDAGRMCTRRNYFMDAGIGA
jgi:NAD(P)-dependent dehydrogenase (short-subunit alcohol dehydrogenase family)